MPPGRKRPRVSEAYESIVEKQRRLSKTKQTILTDKQALEERQRSIIEKKQALDDQVAALKLEEEALAKDKTEILNAAMTDKFLAMQESWDGMMEIVEEHDSVEERLRLLKEIKNRSESAHGELLEMERYLVAEQRVVGEARRKKLEVTAHVMERTGNAGVKNSKILVFKMPPAVLARLRDAESIDVDAETIVVKNESGVRGPRKKSRA